MLLEIPRNLKDYYSVLRLSFAVVTGELAGNLGGLLLYANTYWYHEFKTENDQLMKNIFIIGGGVISAVSVLLAGLGLNYFSKKIYLKDNNDNFNASNINNLENSSNINGIKDASKKTCDGNPI